MIEYLEGDIFQSPAQVIVNTVNTIGVMGKGLALEFKNLYPEMFSAYRTACEKKQLKTGKLMLYYASDHWILLFPTKEHWRYPSKLEYIEAGLMKFVNSYAQKNITSIAFPRLGCGNGELSWDDVRPIMEKYLAPLPIDVYIYLGSGTERIPEHKSTDDTISWLRSNAKDMSFNGVKDDICCSSSLIPLVLRIDNDDWTVMWNETLAFKNSTDKTELLVCEDEFFKIWDEIRSSAVFSVDGKSQTETLVYALLNAYGYLSPIRIKGANTETLSAGYQFNEGSGRLFSLRGIS